MDALVRPLRGPLRKRESHLWSRVEHDWYVEPSWVSERLFETERFEGAIADPACGMGRIVKAAISKGLVATGYDLAQRGDYQPADLVNFIEPGHFVVFDNIVCNPPFSLCDRKDGRPGFVEIALANARSKVALLLPANWVQGDKRSRWLESTPLYKVLFISPRPSMPPGAVIASGGKPGNGTTDYAWLIWLKGFQGSPTLGWLRRDA